MIHIPTKDEYKGFVKTFSAALSKQHPDVCFFGYGSFFEGKGDYGRSDIDGGLIFDTNIVIPKKKFIEISEILAAALAAYPVETGFNPMDKQSAMDGRFLSYSDDYTDFIKTRARVLSGPDLREYLQGKNFKAQILQSASFNFCGPNGTRSVLLYAPHYFNENKDLFVKEVAKALEKTAKFPKKLLWLRGEEVIPSRFAARKKLESILDIDFTELDIINDLLSTPREFFTALYDKKYAIKLLCAAVEFLERIIGAYITKFPQASESELKK